MEPQAPSKTHLTYRVPYADTDQMGMVYYANFLVYFERTRNEVLRERNFTYRQMEEMGFILPVIEAHCEYRRPAQYDDLLDLYGWFESLSPTRIKAHCEVKRGETLLAQGYTVHVCLGARNRRPCKLPKEMLALLQV
jgi:acyl-CoA thioester hydrolase